MLDYANLLRQWLSAEICLSARTDLPSLTHNSYLFMSLAYSVLAC